MGGGGQFPLRGSHAFFTLGMSTCGLVDIVYINVQSISIVILIPINLCRKFRNIDVDFATCLGSPQNTELLDSEKDLFTKAGIEPPHEVMLYPSLLLTNSQRVLVAEERCRSTKRNNSCIRFTTGYGLLSKIIVCGELAEVKCFLLIQELVSAPLELCNDPVTHADLRKHYSAFHPPRYVLHAVQHA